MRYCSECGARTEWRLPAGDNRHRHICVNCHTVHYQNPKIVAGCVAEWQDQVLLCRRAIEPRFGYWTLPGGFMENGETVLEAAVRETVEEANARVEILGLFALFNIPHVNQVYMMYRARLLDLDFEPGSESLDVRLFPPDELPWSELAFTTVRETLRFHVEDRGRGSYQLHIGDIVRGTVREGDSAFVPRRVAPEPAVPAPLGARPADDAEADKGTRSP